MIDPRTTNIVGAHVRVVKRSDAAVVHARGVVRVVDYDQGAFTLLIEAVQESDSESWFCVLKGGLFQVSVIDESIEVLVENGEGMLP